MNFQPFPFDADLDAAMLLAAGYEHQHVPEDFYDDGDAENGPHLGGHPDHDVYELALDGKAHVVVVVDGEVVQAEWTPLPPPDWFDDEFLTP
jgi:hypothetical protein